MVAEESLENILVIINNPPPNEVITTRFGMIAPPCVTSPPRGTGRITISPEQVPQHYRKGGCPSGGGGALKSEFLVRLIF